MTNEKTSKEVINIAALKFAIREEIVKKLRGDAIKNRDTIVGSMDKEIEDFVINIEDIVRTKLLEIELNKPVETIIIER